MFETIRRLFNRGPIEANQPAPRRQAGSLDVVRPRVLQIVYNPPIRSEGGRRLTEVLGWNDPDALVRQYAADLAACSGNYLQYQIVERIDAEGFPRKLDGFRYTGESFMRSWRARQMHDPDQVDYEALVATFDLIGRYDRREIDEVWLCGFPFAGFYESTMVGRGAFWCNSPPVPHTGHCSGRFVIMGFNYERGVDCMLENFGHRVESIMSRVYSRHPPERNLWERFARYDQIAPAQAQCGNVHFAPNSVRDYDWGNLRYVPSYCDDWYSFPDLPGNARRVNCAEWGNGDMRGHHIWWLNHIPRTSGALYGVANNWWEYILLLRDPDMPIE
jgi:hypothetical protein